jgi:hypothetical protein
MNCQAVANNLPFAKQPRRGTLQAIDPEDSSLDGTIDAQHHSSQLIVSAPWILAKTGRTEQLILATGDSQKHGEIAKELTKFVEEVSTVATHVYSTNITVICRQVPARVLQQGETRQA